MVAPRPILRLPLYGHHLCLHIRMQLAMHLHIQTSGTISGKPQILTLWSHVMDMVSSVILRWNQLTQLAISNRMQHTDIYSLARTVHGGDRLCEAESARHWLLWHGVLDQCNSEC